MALVLMLMTTVFDVYADMMTIIALVLTMMIMMALVLTPIMTVSLVLTMMIKMANDSKFWGASKGQNAYLKGQKSKKWQKNG